MGRAGTYPTELRARAGRMVTHVRWVAADLGIHHEARCLWVGKAEVDGIPRGSRVPPTEVEQELKALRKRNAELEHSQQIPREARLAIAAERDRPRRRRRA